MKNYLSKKIEDFKIIVILNLISKKRKSFCYDYIINYINFFIIIIFSIPTFYDYENFDKEIQKKVSKRF